MEAAYSEEKEERTFRSDPAFQRVLDPLNSEQYSAAIKAAESLLPRFPDFDLPYHWLASACRSTGNLQRSKAVLAQGLAQAKRKSVLLTDMGETEWQLGNIHQAVYSWCQALHCSSRAIDYNVYLLVSYVAQGLGLAAEAALFLRRVDELRTGTVRLPAALANRLAELARRSRTPALVRVIEQIARKYLANPAAAQAAPAKAGTVGEVLDRVLLEARQELDAGDQKRLAETLVALCTHEFAAPELRRALGHPDPRIRQWCERFVKAILVE
jgi:tetratricopeptide (TPR) repeat protein